MVESPQANSTMSLESLERDVIAAMSDAVKGSSQFFGGKNDIYSSVLPATVAAASGINKGISAFTEMYGNDGKKSTGNKKTATVKKDVMPKGGTSYFGRRKQAAEALKAAPPALKGSKPNFRNQAFVDKVAASLGLQDMSMGKKNSFQIRGVKAEPNITKNMAELEKIRILIIRMKENPFSNPNGTVNQARLVDGVGVGNEDAERKLSHGMNNSLLNNPEIWDKMGGAPPKFAS
ncbi:MAG: hypothetical protein KAH96_05490 [Alphaproteobacteria bacterium]|nr:hypothetical protein [Alphaproteobacteria bacterium]